MTPEQHYQAAEQLTGNLDQVLTREWATADVGTALLALAHATLAVAGELGVPTGTIAAGPAAAAGPPQSGQPVSG